MALVSNPRLGIRFVADFNSNKKFVSAGVDSTIADLKDIVRRVFHLQNTPSNAITLRFSSVVFPDDFPVQLLLPPDDNDGVPLCMRITAFSVVIQQ